MDSLDNDEFVNQPQEGDYFEAFGVGTWIGPNLLPELTADILEHSLLRSHLFPSLNGSNPELPGIFSSDSLTPYVSRELVKLDFNKRRMGTDYLRFAQTKPDGLARHSGIPHPVAHARLTSLLVDHWDEIKHITENTQSPLRPILTRQGRLFSSTYAEGADDGPDWSELAATGAEFHLRLDIKSFFPSIYTHVFEWVPFGKAAAKVRRKESPLDGHFAEKLDKALKFQNFGQTVGLLVGPGTSNIAAEYLLWPIDSKLSDEFGDKFRRRIDDYEFFATSENEAKLFIRKLEMLLRDFELYLNPQKTKLTPLDQPSETAWKVALGSFDSTRLNNPREFANYWNQALVQFQQTRDQRCLRWGMKTILNRADLNGFRSWAVSFLIRQIRIFPYLATHLSYANKDFLSERDLAELHSILVSKFDHLYSDAKVWLITTLGLNMKLDKMVTDQVINEMDALCLTLLHEFEVISSGELQDVLPDSKLDSHEADRYWLPRYQLSLRNNKVSDPEGMFGVLQNASVNFISR